MTLKKRRPGLFKDNIRFYILLFAGILSVLIAAWLRLQLSGDTLYLIRLQQVYGFAALSFWYLALLATPLGVVFGKQGRMRHYLFARRALGVSAAYFALLHMLIALSKLLGGLSGIWLLPGRFRLALFFGLIGLVCLLAMAATSFDKVIKAMTFRRWKWLHRVGYVGAVLVLLHVWMIGTHLTYPWLRWLLFCMLGLLAVLESWRVALLAEKISGGQDKIMRWFLFFILSVLFLGSLLLVPRTIGSYHQEHEHSQHTEAE